MSDSKPSFLAILCNDSAFAGGIPWAIALSIIAPTLIIAIMYYHVNASNNNLRQQELVLESNKLEAEKISKLSFSEKVIYFNQSKSAIEQSYLIDKVKAEK